MKSIIPALLLFCTNVFGQTPADTTHTDSLHRDIVDRFLEDQIDGFTSPEVLEEMVERIERPLNLNTASREELLALPGMNPLIADALIERRLARGRFRTFPQAGSAVDNDPQIMNSLRMFTYLGAARPDPAIVLRSRILSDLRPSHGFLSGAYQRSRPAVMNRLTWNVREDVETSFLAEKDAGESSLTDFTSGYLLLKDIGWIRSAVIGDFRIESGNGMSFGGTPFLGSGGEMVLSTVRSDRGVLPYRSTSESNFFRGGGMNVAAGSFTGFLFYSNRRIDATLNDSGTVSSVYESGYHRTENERGKRSAAREAVAGLRVNYAMMRNIIFGGTGYTASIDPPLTPADPSKPSGKKFTALSVDYSAAFPLSEKRETFHLSGEWLRDGNGNVGGTTGLVLRYSAIQCEIGYRTYPAKLVSLYGSGSGMHGSSMQNERGISLSFGVHATNDIRIMTFYDLYEFPWRTLRNPLPTAGKDMQFDIEMDVTPSIVARFRYALQNRQDIVESTRQKIRGDVETSLWKGSRFHSRFEWIGAPGETGVLIFQNVQAAVTNGLRVDGRLVYFSTDSYASALYEYESDVTGVFTTPALYGEGIRWYLMARYAVAGICTVGVKYAELRKHGVSSIGSGYDEITGSVDNSVHIQLDVNL